MTNDRAARRWGWPRFRQQPQRAPPAPAAQHLDVQPGQTPGEDTDAPPPRRGWGAQTAQPPRRDAPPVGLLQPRAHRQIHQGGHGHGQPVPRDALGIGAPRPLPVPAEALQGPKAQFDPDPQPVPTAGDGLGGHVRHQQPGGLLALTPDHHQGGREALGALLVGHPRPHPAPARSGHSPLRAPVRAPVAAAGREGRRWHQGGCASGDATHSPEWRATAQDSTSRGRS
jgi:hypothetical protein